MRYAFILAATGALTACGTTEAQECPGPTGFLLGSPVGVTTDQQPKICVKYPGFDPDCVGDTPAFSQALADWNWAPKMKPPIAAMTLGIDLIGIEDQTQIGLEDSDELDGQSVSSPTDVAIMMMGEHGWIALEFAVDAIPSDVLDEDLSDDVAAARACGELESSVFSYVVPGSGIEELPHEEDESVIVLSAADIGLPGTDKIDALNMHMALYDADLDLGGFFSRDLPSEPTIYFTLAAEFIAAEPALAQAWTHLGGQPVTPRTDVILKSSWDEDSNKWSIPAVHRQLDLDPAMDGLGPNNVLEIDGLAIDIEEDKEEIMLSTPTASEANQLRYVRFEGDAVDLSVRPVVFRIGPGRYGTGGSRLRAGRSLGDFCVRDPNPQLGGRPVIDDFQIARRFEPLEGNDPEFMQLSASGFRHAWETRRLIRAIKECRRLIPTPWKPIPGVFMRTSMSWRNARGRQGLATIVWRVVDYDGVFYDNAAAMAVGWNTRNLLFNGDPLVADLPIPRALTGSRGIIAQWFLETDQGELVWSPLLALRL